MRVGRASTRRSGGVQKKIGGLEECPCMMRGSLALTLSANYLPLTAIN
jgi:hypothetical protein